MTGPRHILTPDLINTHVPTPISTKEKKTKKAPAGNGVKRASAKEKEAYYKSTTLMLNKARYVRFKATMARHDRLGQELLTELIDQWMDKMDRKDGLKAPDQADLETLKKYQADLEAQIKALEDQQKARAG